MLYKYKQVFQTLKNVYKSHSAVITLIGNKSFVYFVYPLYHK